jgi:radical SAM protein with 4Fe4S-binding SPASM domain
LVIYWNGDVALCNHDWDRKEPIGNVRDASIQTLWNGSKYKEIRKMHMDGRIENDPTCGGCDHWITHYLPEGMIGRLYKKGKT